MCYSTRSSLTAWLVSVVIAAYLWKRNKRFDRWNSLFILSFSAVQLFEAGIWSSDSERCRNLYLGLLLVALYSQPLAQTFGAWKTTGSIVLKRFIILYGFILLYTVYRIFTEKFYSTVGPNGHLVWNSTGTDFITGGCKILGVLYLIGLFLGLLWALPNSLPLIAIGAITFIWSLTQTSSGEFGSYWCYTAVAYSIVALLV